MYTGRRFCLLLAAILAGLTLFGCANASPPEGTLSYRGEIVVGKLRTYCPPASGAWCSGVADLVLGEKLVVPADSELVFSYGGEGRPSSVELIAYPLSRKSSASRLPESSVSLLSGGQREWKMIDLPSQRIGVLVPVELPTGHYALESSLVAPEGELTYRFRILVEK